jgi:hypothetical protein
MPADLSSFLKIRKPSNKNQLLWRVRAGLRLLSYLNPQYAEVGFAARHEQEKAVDELIRSGKISLTDPFNLLRHNLLGHDQYSTIYPDEGGRTWADGFPDEVKSLETIEITDAKVGGTMITNTVISAARSLSGKLATKIEATLASLQRPATVRIGDLSVFHSEASSPFSASLDADFSSVLIAFFDAILVEIFTLHDAAGLTSAGSTDKLDAYEMCLLQKYREFSAPGAETSVVLLFTAICKAAQPEWPFVDLRWVCGQLSCSHRLCRVHKEGIIRESQPLGSLGMSLAYRNITAYFLGNTVSVQKLLAAVIEHRQGMHWVRRAAESLMTGAEELRGTLETATSSEAFYTIHHNILGNVQAALRGWEYLVAKGSAEQKQEFAILRNACDEIRARSINALFTDFANAIDISRLLKYRLRLALVARESTSRAQQLLNKWIYDETLFPRFWEDFLWGRTNDLSLHQPLRAGRQINFTRRLFAGLAK